MSRQNIFELLKTKWSLREECARLLKLFNKTDTIAYRSHDYTTRQFFSIFCFKDWLNRGRFIDVDEYLEALEFESLSKKASVDVESFITVIEVIYNFYIAALLKVRSHHDYNFTADFVLLKNNMDNYLDHYNYEIHFSKDNAMAIVIEKNAAVTAVVEISTPETAYRIVQYNHHTLKGDISAKKDILLHLAAELEHKRNVLNGINKTFSDEIYDLLNNLNIRHNNCEPNTRFFNRFVADMSSSELEEWYDELYQMILLANLEIDSLQRKKKVQELRTHFTKT